MPCFPKRLTPFFSDGFLQRGLFSPFLLTLTLSVSLLSWSCIASAENQTVKVGIYENEPGVFTDQNGKVQGFYIDLLKYTAEKKGWELEFIQGSWTDNLKRLLTAEIDLLPAIAFTKARQKKYDFTSETAFSNWGQVYVWNSQLDAIPKLKGGIIAGVKDDIYAARFQKVLENFGLEFQFVAASDYETVLYMVSENEVDAGIIPRATGMILDKEFDVFRSPMMCCPMEIRFATKKGLNGHLLAALDLDLHTLKEDSASFYYQSFNLWFEGKTSKAFPSWVLPTLSSVGVLAFLLLLVNVLLRQKVKARTVELEKEIVIRQAAETALRKEMGNLLTYQVAPGVFWLQVPEAGLYILCGCPGEVVKHLMRRGLINTVNKGGVTCETGPNVILLSDLLIQNGGFANLAEFPVLQMLYRQGMLLPGHPSNTGIKPMLIGSPAQVQAQMAYIHRGNYGLVSKEEMMACGVDEKMADILMRIKLKFAFGSIRSPSQFLDTLEIEEDTVEIRNGVTVLRTGVNKFRFGFRGEFTEVDLNLPTGVSYESPYLLGQHRCSQHHFAVIHAGEGDGWDVNRPSMGSIVLFKGRTYLIDAGPGVLQSLTSLGLNVSEVEGVFHTHAHDDHFAGLPALIHSDRRLKYFSTPLVRASVTKKFAALMSLNEEKFGQFFEIHDLKCDQWNEHEGLQIKPIYSPHPLENNLFLFRAKDGDIFKSYAHWADLSSFKVLDGMTGDDEKSVPASFMDKVKSNYLLTANLKKLDIGGGMIHGMAEDFRNDFSDTLVLAHIARKLTSEEMEIGSEATFGAIDVLISKEQDLRKERMFHFLEAFFPEVDGEQIRQLLDSPMVEQNAGTIICRSSDKQDYMDMLLSGTVIYLDSAAGVRNHLSFGSLIGGTSLFGGLEGESWTYRTESACSFIRFSTVKMRAFLEDNGLLAHMKSIMANVWFLRRTWLFGEHTTFLSLGRIAKAIRPVTIKAGDSISMGDTPVLCLIGKGEVHLLDKDNKTVEIIREKGFFGERSYLDSAWLINKNTRWRYQAKDEVSLYLVEMDDLLEIPIVHWKMLEVFLKRNKLLAS